MSWWLKNNIRMIQNNLRDIDAQVIDVDRQVESLKQIGANVLQINCGGISSFYDTQLPFQVRSPYLKNDFFGRMVQKCHENGIRVIARFDFSKLNACLEDRYPQWWIRRADGSLVRYNDTISTCVNSDYQQFRSSEIIREVIERYHIDGVFFNYFGYINFDYSGNRFGICQCENCRRKFRQMFSKELPQDIPENLEMTAQYETFKKQTVREILERIHRTVREISDEIAISTYATDYVDIVRNESNTELDRPLPFWPYASSDNVARIQDSYQDKVCSNVSINAVSFAYRYSSVDAELNRIRLYQNMAAGAGLDFCILGGFEGYPDQKNFAGVREVFQFHKRYEKYYGHFSRQTPILVIQDYDLLGFDASYRGLFRILKEEHLMFRVMTSDSVETMAEPLDDYQFIFVTGTCSLSACTLERLKRTSAAVICFPNAFSDRPEVLKQLFGVTVTQDITDTRAMYVQTLPEKVFGKMRWEGTKWMYLAGNCKTIALEPDTEGILPMVDKAHFGPPERAYGYRETNMAAAAVSKKKNVFFGYDIVGLYYQYGHEFLRKALLNVMCYVRPLHRQVVTDAPDMVEIFFQKINDHQYMLQLINLTGFNGISFFRPVRVAPFSVQLPDLRIRRITELTAEGEKAVCSLKELSLPGLYRAFVIDT